MQHPEKYEKYYSEQKFWKKLRAIASKIGVKVAYPALLLYYTLLDPAVNLRHKSMIIAALGYFILPVDAIPDVLLPLGYSDDIAILLTVIGMVKSHITEATKAQARQVLREWNLVV